MHKCNIWIDIKISNEFIQMRYCFGFQELYCALTVITNHQRLKKADGQPEYGESGCNYSFSIIILTSLYRRSIQSL